MTTSLAIAMMVLLILASLVLLLFEFLTPTFGPLAILALASAAGAVAVAASISRTLAVVLTVSLLIGLPVYVVLMIRLLPRLPLAKGLFLQKAPDATGTALPDAVALDSLVGKEGAAETMLRPSGTIRVEGRRIAARAESGLISKGSAVRIVSAGGSDVVVREI
jgi:membrane-bound serine protease (ClpP class)